MILIHEHYSSPDPAREGELVEVRDRNAAAGIFERILPVSDGGRRTFADLFRIAAERFPGKTCVVANSDIVFDASLAGAEELLRRHDRPLLVALSRWDDPSGPSMEGRIDPATWRFYSHSQDAWVFIAGGLPPFDAGFTLGIPACESRLAFEAVMAGVAIANPALSVRSWHHHASAVRSWRLEESYRGPLYFPRLTTLDVEAFEGYVLDRRRWRTRKEVLRS
jgi:hypothetical protein